jgi:molybdate transport system ATP-binding protein
MAMPLLASAVRRLTSAQRGTRVDFARRAIGIETIEDGSWLGGWVGYGLAMSFEIDIAIRRGDRMVRVAFQSSDGLTALFGPSGAGKTSVLDAVAGLVRPQSGRICVANRVLFDADRKLDLSPERRACGYVFQDNRLFAHRSVSQNLLYGWDLVPPDRRWMEPGEAVEFLGIGHLLDRAPRNLSGGEAQRVAIGRALLAGPRFLLMDEPLASLDAGRREEIMRVIERVRDELRLPILYVSHDRIEVERLADRVVEMPGR